LNPSIDQWLNAVAGNIGTNLGGFHLGAWLPGDMTLGDWGVDMTSHTVWAVLDHNSDFAVVPEPSTLSLLAAGGLGLLAAVRRRRKGRLASGTTVSGQDDAPIMLSFPPRCCYREEATRRAA